MKTKILSTLVAMAMVFTFAAFSPAFAGNTQNMKQKAERVEGVVKSQTVFESNSGQKYLIIGTDQNLSAYIGKKVDVQGLVTNQGANAGAAKNLRIETIEAVG